MAVQVYKDGKRERINPRSIPAYLDLGYSLVDPDAPAPEGVEVLNPDSDYPPPYVPPEPPMPVSGKRGRGRPPKAKHAK